MKELKRVCEINNIHYYIACGTCLGAKRHGGFIPWDSDADVYMFWDDIVKLKAVSRDFGKQYFLQSRVSENCFDSVIYRLRNSNTTYITKDSIGLDINQGIYIDIYPLYYRPSNTISYHYNVLLSYFYRLLVANHPPLNHGNLARIISMALLSIIPRSLKNKIIDSIEIRLRKPKNTDGVLTYYGLDISLIRALVYDSSWFKKPSTIFFESIAFSAPTDVDAYLSFKYGDYMVLPPEYEQIEKLSDLEFMDSEKSYLYYKNIYLK